jgi:hypothetical protein
MGRIALAFGVALVVGPSAIRNPQSAMHAIHLVSPSAWFVAVLDGPTSRSLRIDLGFLGKGRYDALIVRDNQDHPAAVIVEKTALTATTPPTADLGAAGAFVARIAPGESRSPKPASR